MVIYDVVHLGTFDIRRNIRNLFYENAAIQDERVISMLLEKAYMDLEDTLLQHKQKSHLMLILEGKIGTDFHVSKRLDDNASTSHHPTLSSEAQFRRMIS
jgi:NADH dehydrogenase (ubiquinone) 1 alpha subcomplex subunit 6